MLYDRVDLLSPERQARRLVEFHGSVSKALAAHDRWPLSHLARSSAPCPARESRRTRVRAALIALKDRYL